MSPVIQNTPSSWPSQRREPITWPASGRLRGGPWRHGVAVTSIAGRPGASSRVCPLLEPASGAAEPPRARHGRDDRGGGGKQRTAGVVQVVAVLVVAQEHRVDPAELVRLKRRAGGLARRRPQAELVRTAGGVERRVGQQSPLTDHDERGGAADVRQADAAHVTTARPSPPPPRSGCASAPSPTGGRSPQLPPSRTRRGNAAGPGRSRRCRSCTSPCEVAMR